MVYSTRKSKVVYANNNKIDEQCDTNAYASITCKTNAIQSQST